jgi:hypothetical protein
MSKEITEGFEKASQVIEELRALMKRAHEDSNDPQLRFFLEDTGASLDRNLAEARAALPGTLQELAQLEQQRDATAKEAQELIDEGKRRLARLEAEAAAAAHVPVVPAERIDPHLGELLSAELLARFGRPKVAPPAAPPEDPGSVWSHLNAPAAPPKQAPAPRQPSPPAKAPTPAAESDPGSVWSRWVVDPLPPAAPDKPDDGDDWEKVSQAK